MRRSTHFLFSGLIALSVTLSACDTAAPPTLNAEANSFDATVVSPAGVATSLSGAASVTSNPTAFEGTFTTYPTRDSSGTDLTAVLVTLAAESGETLYLGRFAPTALASGTYDIKPIGGFDPPYDFAAVYTADGESASAVSGTVTVTATTGQVGGSFDLTLDNGSELEGSFAAEEE